MNIQQYLSSLNPFGAVFEHIKSSFSKKSKKRKGKYNNAKSKKKAKLKRIRLRKLQKIARKNNRS